jgi:hypothetical protein
MRGSVQRSDAVPTKLEPKNDKEKVRPFGLADKVVNIILSAVVENRWKNKKEPSISDKTP